MFYLPYNTYSDIASRDFRYDALLKELCGQSREIRQLRDGAVSFDEKESGIAKKKLEKILASIMQLRCVNATVDSTPSMNSGQASSPQVI